MLMFTDYLPRTSDYFPRTKRGHGSTHPQPRISKDGVLVSKGCPCVDPTCSRNVPTSKNLHEDQAANRKDWEEAVDHIGHDWVVVRDGTEERILDGAIAQFEGQIPSYEEG